ncbi:DUF2207 domain-containing protein [Microbacterium testaceum]|uniref:DUF2207 domain-containing protein n=1 Tax=Microbacterium testaceum TaxID=2033 RepID=UPI0012ACBD02|nr:DUF2207 domain-containing protein [Microbacterium testaceum]
MTGVATYAAMVRDITQQREPKRRRRSLVVSAVFHGLAFTIMTALLIFRIAAGNAVTPVVFVGGFLVIMELVLFVWALQQIGRRTQPGDRIVDVRAIAPGRRLDHEVDRREQ